MYPDWRPGCQPSISVSISKEFTAKVDCNEEWISTVLCSEVYSGIVQYSIVKYSVVQDSVVFSTL